jgi:hypothetical protein
MIPDFVTPKFLVLAVVAVVAVVLLRRLLRNLFARRDPDPQAGMREDLASYPPPAPPGGPYTLTVEGLPARLRLVVIASAGKQGDLDAKTIESHLEQLVPAFGAVLRQDQPKVRLWPPQLSQQGFTLTFHRLVSGPGREGQSSPWVLVAGRTPPGRRKLLVGLALQTEEPNRIGRLILEPDQWANVLRVQKAER